MGINSERDIEANLQIGPTDAGMVRLFVSADGIEIPMDFDPDEAREIADLYDSDHDFREHVSRYIHDFEAMLRTMLSTRDGNAVSVTLLSSDMGKLYVVLAQALERLR